ncbi:MAG: murein transglycosylase A [Thermodesulfobacteriota bacterium]
MFFLLLAPHGVIAAAGEGCGRATMPVGQQLFADDLDLEGVEAALDRSIASLSRLPPERRFPLCGQEVAAGRLLDSLRAFRGMVADHPSPSELARRIDQHFRVCRSVGQTGQGDMLVTGYFEPRSRASLVRTATFRYPLYRPPSDLITEAGKPGRRERGQVVPYWSRAEIEDGNLLAGQELVWLDDPVAAFVLHVQGSGRVVLPDGSERRVQYAAKNGREYRSIGRVLVERGAIPLAEVTLPRIVAYLRSHPAEQREILHQNDSFIFFRWGDDRAGGPQGCLGEPLTPGRSVALDQTCFPPGALGFLMSQQPVFAESGEIVGWRPLSRFVFNQDTGSAIKGAGRLDLFLGAGQQAEATAGNLKHPGSLYFLVPR